MVLLAAVPYLDFPLLLRLVPRDAARAAGAPPGAGGTSRAELDEEALHRHLYSPQTDSRDSICQPNPFLYTIRGIQGDVSPEAYDLGDGTEIVPGRAARKLAAYLSSLRQNYELPEMPNVVEPEIEIVPIAPIVSSVADAENNESTDE